MNPDIAHTHKADRRVVLLEGIHASAVEALQREGYTDIVTHAQALSGQALLDAVADARLLGIRSRTPLSSDVLHHAQHLMAVGCYCIGTNQVDLEEAMRLGIPVFNAPFSNTRSVAELVLAERFAAGEEAQCHGHANETGGAGDQCPHSDNHTDGGAPYSRGRCPTCPRPTRPRVCHRWPRRRSRRRK